jgi:phage gp16-like protein
MKPDRRRAELAQIHIAKKQLNLDDATYQQMLFTVARVMTSAELDEHGRRRVIEHLRARGFKNQQPKRHFPGRPHNCDSNPQLRKIEALLTVGKKPWSYADAMAQHMFNKDRVAFCDADQLQALIVALEMDKQRNGVKR